MDEDAELSALPAGETAAVFTRFFKSVHEGARLTLVNFRAVRGGGQTVFPAKLAGVTLSGR